MRCKETEEKRMIAVVGQTRLKPRILLIDCSIYSSKETIDYHLIPLFSSVPFAPALFAKTRRTVLLGNQAR